MEFSLKIKQVKVDAATKNIDLVVEYTYGDGTVSTQTLGPSVASFPTADKVADPDMYNRQKDAMVSGLRAYGASWYEGYIAEKQRQEELAAAAASNSAELMEETF